jgi:arsenite-transporting ATPase
VTSEQTSVRLVATPERMVIDEARRAHTDLVLFEVPCDAVVLNRMLPEAAAEEEFFRGWSRLQEERRREVEALFAPLPVLASPLREDEIVGIEALRAHGEALFAKHAPEARLAPAAPVRFVREEGGYRVEIPLPHAERGLLEVSRVEDDLLVRYGPVRRSLRLPPRMAALPVAGARLVDGALRVRLAAPEAAPGEPA